jgi:glyoxylase-like metal-dependent hydrolase (beta-lactamase superfamily II)
VTRQAAIIDAPQGVTSEILEAIEKHHLVVKMILITHSHWDHIADAASLKNKLGAPLYVHSSDAGNLKQPGSDRLTLHFPIEGVSPDGFLNGGDRLELGNLVLEVIETPGHTPGGICLWLEKEKVLFSGDTLFRKSIGRVDLPTGNREDMLNSLKKLGNLPSETKVYPGHGPATTIGAENE